MRQWNLFRRQEIKHEHARENRVEQRQRRADHVPGMYIRPFAIHDRQRIKTQELHENRKLQHQHVDAFTGYSSVIQLVIREHHRGNRYPGNQHIGEFAHCAMQTTTRLANEKRLGN